MEEDKNKMNSNNNVLLENTGIIIPAKNEEKAIGKVIDEIIETGIKRENIIVVDGHSTDNTRRVASEKGVKVIEQSGTGKANAVEEGLRIMKDFKYNVIIDADYTYPAKHIPQIVRELENKQLDEVIGARTFGKDNIPRINRFGNWALTKIFNILFGTNLTDVCSGLYGIRTRTLLDDSPFPVETHGFSIEAEIAAKIASSTGRIAEIPIGYRKRIGEAKLKVGDGVKIGLSMIQLAWRYNPVFILFALSSLLIIPGLLLGAFTGYHYFVTGTKYYVKGLVAIILTATGLVSIIMGIFALYMKRLEFRVSHQLKTIHELLEKKQENNK